MRIGGSQAATTAACLARPQARGPLRFLYQQRVLSSFFASTLVLMALRVVALYAASSCIQNFPCDSVVLHIVQERAPWRRRKKMMP